MAKQSNKKKTAKVERAPVEQEIVEKSGGGLLPEDPKDRILIFLSLAGLVVVFYLLFFWERSTLVNGGKVVGVLRTDRMVRRRHARNLHWHDLKRQETIYLQDIVYTPRGSQAVVTFADGRTLELKQDSMVQFDELTVDGIQITLFDLSDKEREQQDFFRLVPYPKIVKTNLLQDPGGLELRQSEYSDRLKKALSKPLEIARVKRTVMPRFVLDQLKDYTVRLVRPENKEFNLATNRWVQAVWTPVPLPDVKFELQISVDSDFGKFLTHRAKKNQLLVQFENPGRYYWRIKAIQGADHIYSRVGAFSLSYGGGIKRRISGSKEAQ